MIEHRQKAGLVQELDERAGQNGRLGGAPVEALVHLGEGVQEQVEDALVRLFFREQGGGGFADDRRRGHRLAIRTQPLKGGHELSGRDGEQRAAAIRAPGRTR